MPGHHFEMQQILNQIRNELSADAAAARQMEPGGPVQQPASPSRDELAPIPFDRYDVGRHDVRPLRDRTKPCTVAEVAELRAVVQAARSSRTLGRLHWLELRHFTDAQLYHISRLGILTQSEAICVRNNVRNAWDDFDDEAIIAWLNSLPDLERKALLRQGLLSFARMPMIQLQRFLNALPVAH